MLEKGKCSSCGEKFNLTEGIYEIYGKYICEYCADNYTTICEHCHQRVWNSEDFGEDDYPVCGDCFERFYTRCQICDALMNRRDAVNYKGTVYCNRCYTETLEDKRNSLIADS